jgi:DNA-binding NtrC family response regulator
MKILIVDDNESLARGLKIFLTEEGHSPEVAFSVAEGKHKIEEMEFDLVITDLKLPDGDGIEIIKKTRDLPVSPFPDVILMTAFGSIETAVEAMKLGANDYLTKPVSMEEFAFRIKRIHEYRKIETQNSALLRSRESLIEESGFDCSLDRIAGESSEINDVKEIIKKVAAFPSTVLVSGETGVGKEMVAKALHTLSPWSEGPFIRVNCASIPLTLFESELFGHEKGAFTDAKSRRIGRFEAAEGGTLFLDEVGEIPLEVQAKMLRALQEKEITRVGSSSPIKVNARIVAATNRNLEKMSADGTFREDLLYRLSVVKIKVPALRERKKDIPVLCSHLLKSLGAELGKVGVAISRDALQILTEQEWPGNIRQLKNLLERALVLSNTDVLQLKDFGFNDVSSLNLDVAAPVIASQYSEGLIETLERIEKQMILSALSKAGGVKSKAADILKIPRTQLLYRLKRLGIDEDP